MSQTEYRQSTETDSDGEDEPVADREPFADPPSLSRMGNAVGVSQPINTLREHDLVDEDDRPREDVDVEQAIVREDGQAKLVTEIPLQ